MVNTWLCVPLPTHCRNNLFLCRLAPGISWLASFGPFSEVVYCSISFVIYLYFLSIRVIASVTSSTHEIKSKTVITMDKEKIYLQLNQFMKPVCIANPVTS